MSSSKLAQKATVRSRGGGTIGPGNRVKSYDHKFMTEEEAALDPSYVPTNKKNQSPLCDECRQRKLRCAPPSTADPTDRCSTCVKHGIETCIKKNCYIAKDTTSLRSLKCAFCLRSKVRCNGETPCNKCKGRPRANDCLPSLSRPSEPAVTTDTAHATTSGAKAGDTAVSPRTTPQYLANVIIHTEPIQSIRSQSCQRCQRKRLICLESIPVGGPCASCKDDFECLYDT